MNKAIRWNRGKPRLSLICPHFAEDTARLLGEGEERYGRGNWKRGLPISEVLDSLKRHTAAIEQGEDTDPDTGLPHTSAIACNAMFLHHYHRTGRKELDDRHHAERPEVDQVPPMWAGEAREQFCPEPTDEERFSVQPMQEHTEESPEESEDPIRAIERDPVQHLQRRIADWADQVFPDRTAHGALSKLVMEEIPELLNGGLDDPHEYADVLILILDVASLRGIDAIKAAHEKMAINEARKWEIDKSTGLMHHIEESEAPARYEVLFDDNTGIYEILGTERDQIKTVTETRNAYLAHWIKGQLNSGRTWRELNMSDDLHMAMKRWV